MPFSFSSSNQFEQVEHQFKAAMYQNIHKCANHSKYGRTFVCFSGLGIGIVSGLSTIIKEIVLIAECIFKGLINILGSPFKQSQCHLLTGLRQLFLDTGAHLLRLPFCVGSAVFGLLWKTVCIANSPKNYTYSLWTDHDAVEKQAQVERPKIAKFQHALNSFNEDELTDDPVLIGHIKTVADCYLRGYGVSADRDLAIKYYTMAAELADVSSMKILGDIYMLKTPKDLNLSISWYKKAGAAGDYEAYKCLGLYYYTIQGREKTAIECFRRAAARGCPSSEGYLLEMLERHPNFAVNPLEVQTLVESCSTTARAKARLSLSKLD